MNKEFVPYQESLELKELGFNEPCFGYYNDNKFGFFPNISTYTTNSEFKFYPTAPLYQQAFRFFREKYNLPSTIIYRVNIDDGGICYDWLIIGQDVKYRHFDTYEDAELECIRKLIEIVKKK